MGENRGKSVHCFLGLFHFVLDGGHRDIVSLWFSGFLKMMLRVF